MLKNFNDIKNLYQTVTKLPKLNNSYCIIFIYNSPKTMFDAIHDSECVFDEELHMILNSFRKIANNVYSIDGEDSFLQNIKYFKEKYHYVLIYSMAQNLKGNGRRSLIPLLCDYYNLINIGADFLSCTMGRSKDIMYSLLKPYGFPFPKTYYVYDKNDINNFLPKITPGIWLLKPNNESSSIGMEVHDLCGKSEQYIIDLLNLYHKKYPVFCVQEFIEGEEVAVPILKIKDSYYCPGISQVDFPSGKNYIDYDMVSCETYGYYEYAGPIKEQLIRISANVSRTLKLTAMSRIDFRICNNIPYIEDIGANPTISEHNGVNQLYCDHLAAGPEAIYAILTYAALIEHNLFKPPFH